GGHGPARGELSTADVSATAGVEAEDHQGPGRSRPDHANAQADAGLVSQQSDIEALVAAGSSAERHTARAVFVRLRQALSAGDVRAASPDPSTPTGWRVNTWVKHGILLGFRFGETVDMSLTHVERQLQFFDKDTLPVRRFRAGAQAGIRLVPGGSAIRDGA